MKLVIATVAISLLSSTGLAMANKKCKWFLGTAQNQAVEGSSYISAQSTAVKNLQQKIDEIGDPVTAASKKHLSDLHAKLARAQGNDAKRIVSAVTARARQNSAVERYVNEQLAMFSFMRAVNPERTVALLLGNSESEVGEYVRKPYIKIAETLVSWGYTVVYDANAKTADLMRKVTGARGIGIHSDGSEGFSPDGLSITLTNPHHRLDALQIPVYRIVASDSVSGLALQLLGKATHAMRPDAASVWPQGLRGWQKQLDTVGTNAGIKYEKIVNPPVPTFAMLEQKARTNLSLHDLSYQELQKLVGYVGTFINAEGIERAPGAVVFGSAKLRPVSAHRAYRIGRTLAMRGLSITTGGAGGTMLATNSGAFDAGGESIGIPKISGELLAHEKKVHNEVHSLTIPAHDYQTRVPLLLEKNPLVVVEAGGMGTMREIAVTLLQMQAKPELKTQIVFIDREYYGPLLRWFGALDLPHGLLRQVHLRADAWELGSLLEALMARGDLPRVARPNLTPRNPKQWFDYQHYEGRD